MSLVLSVLDQSPIRSGHSAAEALAESLELARLADRLGFHRYWVAEHHNSRGLAGAAPEILIARLAAETRDLRLGSGGVMLSHYSPLKVAEQFRVLEALAPGRIDLGIGRAPGSDRLTAMALRVGPGGLGIEHFPAQIADLIDYLGEGPPSGHPFAGVRAAPEIAGQPELWLLGSSDQGAQLAAHFGCAFSFAHFIAPDHGPEMMRLYQGQFRPSPRLSRPLGSIGVFVIVAETEAEADRLALSRDLWRLRLERGDPGPFPSVEEAEAAAAGWSRAERLRVAASRRGIVTGTPEAVRARLEALAAAYGVGELVVVSILHDHQARLRSYQLLAQAFGLAPRAAAA